MVLVGAILLVLCLLLGAGVYFSNPDPVVAEAFGGSLPEFSLGGLFLFGVLVGAVTLLSLGMVLGGAARKRRKKVALKREVRSARGEQETLAEQNARLQAELEHERTASLPDGGVVTDGSGGRGRL